MPETVSTEPNMPNHERVNPQRTELKSSPKWFQNLPGAGRILAALGLIANTGALAHNHLTNSAEALGTPVSGYSQTGLTPDQRLAQSGIRVERKEQEIITNYTPNMLRVYGDRAFGAIKAADGRNLVVESTTTDLLSTNPKLTAITEVDFDVVSVASLESNPLIKVVSGTTINSNTAARSLHISSTIDGVNWNKTIIPGMQSADTQITPDGLYSFTSALKDIASPMVLVKKDLTTNLTTEIQISGPTSNQIFKKMTPLRNSNGGYINEGLPQLDTGYNLLTYSGNTITSQRQGIDNGRGNDLDYTMISNENIIWETKLVDLSTNGREIGAIYRSNSTTAIFPIKALEGNNESVTLSMSSYTISTGKGYMGASITVNGDGNTRKHIIEEFDTSRPNEASLRRLIPSNNSFPSTPSMYRGYSFLEGITAGNNNFLLAGFYESETASENGIFIGSTASGNWNKISIEILANTTPTPTATPSATSIPSQPYRSFLPMNAREKNNL